MAGSKWKLVDALAKGSVKRATPTGKSAPKGGAKAVMKSMNESNMGTGQVKFGGKKKKKKKPM